MDEFADRHLIHVFDQMSASILNKQNRFMYDENVLLVYL